MVPSGKIGRSEAAKRLNVSVGTLQKLELAGRLVIEKVDGRCWYDLTEFELFAANYRPARKTVVKVVRTKASKVRGALAAKVYAMLEAGKSHREIVIATQADPDQLVEIYRHYKLGPEGIERARQDEEALARIERQGKELARETRRSEWMRWTERMRKIPRPPTATEEKPHEAPPPNRPDRDPAGGAPAQ